MVIKPDLWLKKFKRHLPDVFVVVTIVVVERVVSVVVVFWIFRFGLIGVPWVAADGGVVDVLFGVVVVGSVVIIRTVEMPNLI